MTVKRIESVVAAVVLAVLLGSGCSAPRKSPNYSVGQDPDKHSPTHAENAKELIGRRVLLTTYDGVRARGVLKRYEKFEVRLLTDDGDLMRTTPRNVATLTELGDQNGPATLPVTGNREAVVVLFRKEHKLSDCARSADGGKSQADALLASPDSVLFHDKKSRVVLRVPAEQEHYHAHLFYREEEGGEIRERLYHEGSQRTGETARKGTGRIEIDLASLPHPEHLVVSSWAHIEKEKNPAASSVEESAERAVIPPLFMSLRLVGRSKADAIVSLQEGRHEIRTPAGSIDLVTGPFNHADMIVTVVDREQKFSGLLHDGFIGYRPMDARIRERLIAEVYNPAGILHQRTVICPVPSDYPKDDPDAKVFSWRTNDYELLRFSAPPQLKIVVAQANPRTEAKLAARYTGLSAEDSCQLVLSRTWAGTEDGALTTHVEEKTVESETKEESFTLSASEASADLFPLTVAVSHRFVRPWKMEGGRLPAISTVVQNGLLGMVGPPTNIIEPKTASHFFFLTFSGPEGAPGMTPFSLPGDSVSPNLNPGSIPGPGSSVTSHVSSSTTTGPDANGPWILGGPGPGPGPNPGPGGGGKKSAVGQIFIKLQCMGKPEGCTKMHFGGCKCTTHLWKWSDIVDGIKKGDSLKWNGMNPRQYEPANPFPGGGSKFSGQSACHKWQRVLLVQAEYRVSAAMGMKTPVYRWYKVWVMFGPCLDNNLKPIDPPEPIPAPGDGVAGNGGKGGDGGHGGKGGDGGKGGCGKKTGCCCCCCGHGKHGKGVPTIPFGSVEGGQEWK